MTTPAVSAPAGSIMGLLDLLGKLGANLPAFMVFAQTIIQAWQTLQHAVNPATVGKLMASAPLTAEEAHAVNALHAQLRPKLLALPAHPGGNPVMLFGDAHIFASLFAFAKAHPMIMQALEQIAKGLITGGV